MSDEKELSIIVPVYNAAKYLEQCLESVLGQKYEAFELILVNDGSTDSSFSICEKYARRDGRIVLIDKENAGQALATKAGLDISKGKYIGFVDSDDWISPDHFSSLMQVALEKNAEVVATGGYRVSGKNKTPVLNKLSAGYYDRKGIEEYIIPNMLGNRDLYGNRAMQSVKWLKVYKKELLTYAYSVAPIDVRLGEDMAITYAAVAKASSLEILDESHKTYFYRYNRDSVSWTYREKAFERSVSLCAFLESLPECQKSEAYQIDVAYEYCFFAINALYNEYLMKNAKSGRERAESVEAVMNEPHFNLALTKIDYETVKFPNGIMLKLLSSKKIGLVKVAGRIMSVFRRPILSISQHWL